MKTALPCFLTFCLLSCSGSGIPRTLSTVELSRRVAVLYDLPQMEDLLLRIGLDDKKTVDDEFEELAKEKKWNIEHRLTYRVGLDLLLRLAKADMVKELRRSLDLRSEAELIFGPIYAKHYSGAELRSLLDFFESDLGKKMQSLRRKFEDEAELAISSKLMPKVMEESRRVIASQMRRSIQEVEAQK